MVTNGKLPERELVDRLTSRGGCWVDGAREATRALGEAGRLPDAFHRRRVPYEGPVYAVWGDRDRMVPASHRQGVRAAFPQAQVEVWKRMGHHAARERTEDLIAVVARAATAGARQAPRAALSQAGAA
jgi:pimeloyl-ACP methyl ester carboxylesterase